MYFNKHIFEIFEFLKYYVIYSLYLQIIFKLNLSYFSNSMVFKRALLIKLLILMFNVFWNTTQCLLHIFQNGKIIRIILPYFKIVCLYY